MNSLFVELPPFERNRTRYLDDSAFLSLQQELMRMPNAGDLIMGAGGLRKLRFSDARRNKGKRGGTRIIYYWWETGAQFWLFTLYDKDEVSDLSEKDRERLAQMLKAELNARTKLKIQS